MEFSPIGPRSKGTETPSTAPASRSSSVKKGHGYGHGHDAVEMDRDLLQDDSDTSDVEPSVFKWLGRINSIDLRIRCDVFQEPRKVNLELTLSSGRHLAIDSLRQGSDDSGISEDHSKTKNYMARTYKGRDLIKIRSTNEAKTFTIMEPASERPISSLNVTHSSMEVHNLLSDEWYYVDISNRRSQLILIRNQNGLELGRITGFGNFEPQSSSNGNVMVLKPKMKLDESLDNVQKVILLSVFIALGLTFDCDMKKTTDAFNLLVTFLIIIFVLCAFVIYRSSESVRDYGSLLYAINGVVLIVVLGLLYLIRWCLR